MSDATTQPAVIGETVSQIAAATQPVSPTLQAQAQAQPVIAMLLSNLTNSPLAQSAIAFTFALAISAIAFFLVHRYLIALVGLAVKRTPNWWGPILLEKRVFHRLAMAVPVIVFARLIDLVPHLPPQFLLFLHRITETVTVLIVATAFGALLTAANDVYSRYPISQGRPIKGYLQVLKILIYIAAGIVMITALMGLEPFWFLSGLGAMTAVILLIFRDTLLSLVAGMQLVNNDLVRVGDWIELPQFNADGDVIDISLNVVKIRNWDNTITVIPTYKFLDHSFKNWRGMSETGGRRIKRAIHIDMSTIRFLSQDEIARFGRFSLLKDYMQAKQQEIHDYNLQHAPKDTHDILANSRHLTNIGTFRAYILNYLRSHPMIHKDMTIIVRQLAPTPSGLPMEIYVFTSDTRWSFYEDIQSDIFDHTLAIITEFGLHTFQSPSGRDLTAFRPAQAHAVPAPSPGASSTNESPAMT